MRRGFRQRKLAVRFALERVQPVGGDKPKPAGVVVREAMNQGIELLERAGVAPEGRGVMKQAGGSGQPECAAGFHRHVIVPAGGNILILRQLCLSRRLPKQGIRGHNP